MLFGLPTPKDLYNLVWKLLPAYVRSKVTEWAKKGLEGPIANEIRDFVKTALGLLPIPIPSFFINSVVNLVIPPLVKYIIRFLSPVGHAFYSLSTHG